MAITRAQVQAAVEKYLPRTVNYAQSADLADRSHDAIFERIRQIVFTNLLVDPDAVFYLVFLSVQRLLVDVNATLALLDSLQSEGQLKGITGQVPVRVEDISQLSAARRSLVRLSTGLVTEGAFGETALTTFQDDIEGFMEDELVPNVSGGNRVQISTDIRATMAALQTSWANVLERRDLVFTLLDKYTGEDLRTQVSSTIITGIQETLKALESTILTLSTEDQADQAEATLVDLAAAEAALNIAGGAPSPLGTLLVGPANDGRTLADYLIIEGTCSAEPTRPIVKGTNGELLLQGPTAGAPFSSLLGNTVAPGSGTLTSTVTDGGGVDYLAEGILPGMYLTFVDLGRTHAIDAVTSSELTLNMALTHRAGDDLRYAITDHAVGRYFQDVDYDFWTEYDPGGGGASTSIASGSGGAFPRTAKVSAVDGTNIAASGTAMELRPRLASGTAGAQTIATAGFTDAGGTFLTDLIELGDALLMTSGANIGTQFVSVVNSETSLDISSTWAANSSGDTWVLEDLDAEDQFEVPGQSFLTLNMAPFSTLRITSAPGNGIAVPTDYLLDGFFSQTLGQVGIGTGNWVNETGVDWEILDALRTRLYSSSVDFLSAGVVVGDQVDIVGEGVFGVTAVNQDYITLDGMLSATSFAGATFDIYPVANGAVTNRFSQGSVDFVALGISNVVTVTEYRGGVTVDVQTPTVLEADGVEYAVRSRDPADPTGTLIISPLSTGSGEFTSSTVFEDLTAAWQTEGVDIAKHELVVQGGANEGVAFPLASVDSDTQITITGTAILAAGEVYEIFPKVAAATLVWEARAGNSTRNFLDKNANAPFTAESEGQIVVWNPGAVNEIRSRIDTYISSSEVWLVDAIPQDSDDDYAVQGLVFEGMELLAAGRSYSIKGILSKNALDVDPKLSNAPGKGIAWQIRLAGGEASTYRLEDPNLTALSITGYPGGFPGARDPITEEFLTPNDFFNYRVDLMADNPVKARYVKGIDADGDSFAEAFQVDTAVPLGLRNVAYKILQDFQGLSDTFLGAEVAPLPLAGDTLAVWGHIDIFTLSGAAVSASPDMQLPISPAAPSGLVGQDYVLTRGGSQYYGRYLLFDNLNSGLELNADTSLLRLKVAEVLIDFGTEVVAIDDNTDGAVINDGDDDGLSDLFTSVAADFSTAKFGDRLTVGAEVTFVSAVLGDTTLRVAPAVSEGTGLTWALERNSVSASLEEAELLRTQVIELQAILVGYVIPRNAVIEGIVGLLEEQRLGRAIDLLFDGEVDEFINLTSSESSYSSRARSSIQTAGIRATASPQLQLNVGGLNPETGQPGTSSTGATNLNSTVPSNEDVDTRVAFAKAIADLASDELMRSLSFATFEEQRNRAIYELSGEVRSGFISDTDPTLPWIQGSGSLRARINERYQKARVAIQYMLDHPDEFCEPDPLEDP